jgi:hypothetical protein
VVNRCERASPRVKADRLAHDLNIDRKTRERLRLRTIGAIDFPKDLREQHRKSEREAAP